ncbi:MAG TPA: hypothetical protein VII36_13250 [Usitatibacter sp.]
MTGYEAVMKSIQGMATGMGSWATLLAAVGAFAMALLEFLKGFLPMREVFNRDELVAWIAGRGRAGRSRGASPRGTRRRLTFPPRRNACWRSSSICRSAAHRSRPRSSTSPSRR